MFKVNNISTFKILDWITKGALYLVTFLTPLFFLPIAGITVDFAKQALLLFLVMIALAAFVLKALVKKEFEIKRTPLNYVVLGLVGVTAVSVLFSWDPVQSFFGSVSFPAPGFLSLLLLAILFFLIVNTFNTKKGIKRLVGTGISSASLAALFGVLQAWGVFLLPWNFTQTKAFNTVGSVNPLALFLVTLLPVSISLLFVKKEMWTRIGLSAFGVLALLFAIVTNYWVIWISLGVGMLALIIFLKTIPAQTDDGWIVAPVVLLVIAFSFALIGPVQFSPTYSLSFGMAKKVITQQGLRQALLGTGPSTFSHVYSLFKPQAINKTVLWSVNFQNAPSQMLGLIATNGILGILAWFGLIGSFGFVGIKELITGERRKFGLKESLTVGLFSGWLTLAVGKFLYPVNLSLEFLFWSLMALLVVIKFSKK